jgi:hypothetical protein
MNIINIKIKDIKSNPTYQRDVKRGIVRHIVDNFDENQLGLITVVFKSDGYYVIDGQHRILALIILGIERVDCILANNCNEADLFISLNNNRRSLDTVGLYKARIAAGDEKCMEIDRIVTNLGYKIPINSSNRSNNTIVAIQSVESVYKKYGAKHLEKTLKTIREIYGIDSRTVKSGFIKGYAYFIKKTNVDVGELVDRMQKYSYQKLENLAKSNKALMGGLEERAMAKAILEFFNENKKKKIMAEL